MKNKIKDVNITEEQVKKNLESIKKEVGGEKDTKIGKMAWVTGSIALLIAAFCMVPKLQKELNNKIYKMMK